MPYVYLVLSTVGAAFASVFGAFYNRKNADTKAPATLYNLIYCMSAFLGWVVLFIIEPSFDVAVLPYSIAFGVSYVICNLGLINALNTGPVSLTTLLLQLALIGTTIWGFIFWNDDITVLVVIGLILVVISLWLCLYTKEPKGSAKRITWKWLVFAFMAFAGNAGCSIIQRTQQLKFNGKHGNMLMMFALVISVLFTLIHYLLSDKSDTKIILKRSVGFPIVAGIANVVSNVCVILLASTTLSPSIIYPVIGVGGLSITSIFSFIVFRERLRPTQWVGMAIGAVAVVLLSI